MIKPGWQDKFIAAYRQCGNIRAASQAAGVTRDAVYKRQKADPEFAARWQQAHEDAVDLLEAVAWKRATVEQSDRMLELLLKANRPEKYAERLIILKKAAETVKSASDADILALLGYDGPPEGTPSAVSAGGGAAEGDPPDS
jgi:hypothetical protein